MAIQPPSVECVNESGKWPNVYPSAASCSSRRGPKTPAWTRASRESASISSTWSRRSRSTEITGRASSAGASSEPEIEEPPPNGITTASARSAACIDRGDLVLAAGPHDDVREPRRARRGAAGSGRAATCRARGSTRSSGSVETYGPRDRLLSAARKLVRQLRIGDVQLVEARPARRSSGGRRRRWRRR